jgi:uncharacterized protein YjiS (DUF1127 family)
LVEVLQWIIPGRDGRNGPSMRRYPKKRAALPLRACRMIAMLVRAICQIVGSRRELGRLADLDDRMLADIGLTRSDLHAARFAPLWQDPTSSLKRRWKSERQLESRPEDDGRRLMKWITRERVKVDRVACPWLIKKFVDQEAEFIFVPPDKVMEEAKRLGATPYDVKDVELGHHGKECSFEAILKKHELTNNPALVLLGKIVNGADTDNTLYHQPEGPGLEAIAEGFRHLGFKDDHAVNAAEWIVYDALYAYCEEMVRQGKPNGDFAP